MLPQPEQDALIVTHLHTAEHGARRYSSLYRRHYEADEFRAAAHLGLVEAARTYDPTKGTQFKTWAFFYIDKRLKGVIRTEKRARGWSYTPTHAEQAAGVSGMVRRVTVCAWPTSPDPTADPFDVPAPDTTALLERRLTLDRAFRRLRLTPADRALLDRYRRGDSLVHIAAALGSTKQAIWARLRTLATRAARRLPRRAA